MKKAIVLFLSLGLLVFAGCMAITPPKQEDQLQTSEQQTKLHTEARPSRPEDKEEQLKWLAEEFQHRHYLAVIDGKEQDRSDIVENNDDMELWRINMLNHLKIQSNSKSKIELTNRTFSGSLNILEEKDGQIIAEIVVQTVYRNVGSDSYTSAESIYTITYKELDGKYIIINCDGEDKGGYSYLKYLREKYMSQGLSKSEANKKILEEKILMVSKEHTVK